MPNHDKQLTLHKILSSQFDLPTSFNRDSVDLVKEFRLSIDLQQEIVASENLLIPDFKTSDANNYISGHDFVKKLRAVINNHAAANHYFYTEYLPNIASLDDLKFYLAQENFQDPRFDDFIAYLQVGLPINVKMELASNYWDEMGNGETSRAHTVMFNKTMSILGINDDFAIENLTANGLLCGNLSAMMVLRRDLIYRAIGYFATIEFLFPRRCLSLISAWNRLGLDSAGIVYHYEHVKVDSLHAASFFNQVIAPLVDLNPDCASEIYWGLFVRLNSSQRHLNALIEELKTI